MRTKTILPVLLALLLAACTKDSIQPEAPNNPNIDVRDHEVEYPAGDDETCPCKPVQYVSVSNVTDVSALVSWGASVNCGKYSILIYNLTTGSSQYLTGISGSSYQLTGLLPCSDYEIAVGHEGSDCVAYPVEQLITTDCSCQLGSSNSNDLYVQYITLTSNQHPGVWSDISYLGYVDQTNHTINLPLNSFTDLSFVGICTDGNWTGGIFARLWIDYNNNGIFENTETAYTISIPFIQGWGSKTCLSVGMQDFPTPGQPGCGLRARYIISSDPITGPCTVINRGQIVDFRVNLGDC